MVYLMTGLKCLVGVVFLLALCGKTVVRGGFGGFERSLRDLRVVPRAYLRPVAVLVVAGEAGVVLALAVPGRATAVVGFGLATALLLVFAAGIARGLRRGSRTPCRCFGASTTPLGPHHLLRNLLLAVLAVLGATTTVVAAPGGHPAGALVAAAAGLVLGALAATLDELLALFQPMTPQRR